MNFYWFLAMFNVLSFFASAQDESWGWATLCLVNILVFSFMGSLEGRK